MSNGHPKQRRGGAAHARHGPQRQERAAAPSGAPGAPSAIGAGQANGQTTAPTNGAKRPAKPNDNRVMLQPPPAAPARPLASAAPTATVAPGERQKPAHGERSAPTPPTPPTRLPVVRRRGGPVIVPPVSRAAPSLPGAAANQPQALGSDGAPASQQPVPADTANQPPMGAFVISLAQRDLEVAIEVTSVEPFTSEAERIDTVVEIDETPTTDDRDGGASASGASDDTPGANPTVRRRAGAGAANGAPSGLAATTDAAASDDADTAPALPVTPAPRARVGHFYAPGGPMRPDESWVDRAAGNAADHGVNAADHDASAAPPQSRYGGPGNPAPYTAYTPYTIPEHVEHFDHSTRVGPRDDLGRLIDSLHGLFEQDRAVASQTGAARCGACYLHFPLADLDYREQEGFYVCPACKRSLGAANIPMVRRQQR